MEHLPSGILLDILSRLPITSLVQSESVCRAWRSIIQDSFLAHKHLSLMAENDPGIIFQSVFPDQNIYYFLDFAAYLEGNKIFKKMSLSIQGRLEGSCNGLLCLYSASAGIHICNPLTKDSIKLPKLPRDPKAEVNFGFGFSPATKEYKLVVIVYKSKRSNSEVRILTIHDSRWRNLGMVPYRFDPRASQVTVNGRLHWISNPGKYNMDNKFISFDLTSEKFQEVPKPDCGILDMCFHELVAHQGHLSAVNYNATSGGLEIWVMKKYNIKESWIKEFNIGGCVRDRELDIPFIGSKFRVICCFRSGEILLQKVLSSTLILYDPVHKTFGLTFEGLPYWSRIVVHVGSLISI